MRKRPRIGAMLDKKETNSEGKERSSDRIVEERRKRTEEKKESKKLKACCVHI